MRRWVTRSLAIIAMISPMSCSEQVAVHADRPHVELAPYMTRLQTFSQKLGYSTAAKNLELSGFYVHELEETVDEIVTAVPTHDGHDIASLANGLMMPALSQIEQALEGTDWELAWTRYEGLITGCNTCHAATAHGFIRILPAFGLSPFNQQFESSAPAPPK